MARKKTQIFLKFYKNDGGGWGMGEVFGGCQVKYGKAPSC